MNYPDIVIDNTMTMFVISAMYRISLAIRVFFFFSQKSGSILQEGSRFMGLLRKVKTPITAKFHGTSSIISSHSREGKTCLIAE